MCVRYSAKCEQDYKPILAPQQSCFYPPRGQDSCKARHIRGDCGQLEAQLECAVSLSLNNHGTAQTVAKANLGTAVAIPGGNEETKRLPGGSTVFQAMCGHLQRIYPISYGGLCTGTGCVTSDGRTSQHLSSLHCALQLWHCPTFLLLSTLFLSLLFPTWCPYGAFQSRSPKACPLTILPSFHLNIQTLPLSLKPIFGTISLTFLGLPKSWGQSDKVSLPCDDGG